MEKNIAAKNASIAASQALKEKNYWLSQLDGDLKNVRHGFPYDYETRETGKRSLEEIKFQFPRESLIQLKKISKEAHPKIFMMLTAALQALLYKYTGARDIMVCTPIYRQKIKADFINTILVLRNQPAPHLTFKDLLFQVRDRLLEAVENQNYPLQNLLYEKNPSLFPDDRLVIDTAVLLENIHDPEYIRSVHFNSCFNFRIHEESLELSLQYNSTRYKPNTMERLIEHYDILMREVLTQVNIRLDQLSILSTAERNRILYDFNRSEAEYPAHNTIHHLFALQVEKTPFPIAVTYEKNHLSYGELNNRSNALAGVLREKGVSPDTITAIIVPPSLELIIAIIGVLKAGGAYLPIDPTYPEERIKYMLADSNVKILVKKSNNISEFLAGGSQEIISMDDVYIYFSSPHSPHLYPLSRHIPGTGLAYVIYTSGSTGNPKGVLVEHSSILNYIYWRISRYTITAADVSLQLVSAAFDGFCSNLYPTLLTGGRTVLLNLAKWRDTRYIRAVIRQQAVTHFSAVPSIYMMLLEGAAGKEFDTLRFVVLAGEKAPSRLIEKSEHLLSHVQLINEYGPTENSVATTANIGITPGNTPVIGTPIANNQVFILDPDQHIVPIGTAGELCVSGSGLGRGYLNKPELTNEKFCLLQPGALFEKTAPGPRKNFLLEGTRGLAPLYEEVPGKRIERIHYMSYMSHMTYVYKTGDLAKWQPDGKIQILGRIDHQLQVRGSRIEPEEIEKHLQKYEEIKDAVVVVKKDKHEDTYLCAYVVRRHPGETMNVTQYKEFLLTQLPDFMVPARFVQLEKIPLNINGKADRKLLTEMELTTEPQTCCIAPRNETEKKLVKMWEHLLDMEKIGIRDNFFNIGGDSIKVISLLNSINKDFGTNLKVVDLYENGTIEKITDTINKAKTTQVDQTLEQAKEEIDDIKNKFLQGI